MASAPTTWKNGVRLLRKEIAGMLINAKPAKIQAKNNAATWFIHVPPFE